jgi:hypothetical protein
MSDSDSANPSRPDNDLAGQLAALSMRLADLEKLLAKSPDAQERSDSDGVSDREMLEELNFLTNRVSELVRYVAFGLAALFFVLVSSSSDFAKTMMQNHGTFILGLSGVGCFAILADYSQYLFGRIYVKGVFDRASHGGSRFYNKRHPLYLIRQGSSWTKQFLAGSGAIALIGLLIYVYYSGELLTAQNCLDQKKPLPTALTVRTMSRFPKGC